MLDLHDAHPGGGQVIQDVAEQRGLRCPRPREPASTAIHRISLRRLPAATANPVTVPESVMIQAS